MATIREILNSDLFKNATPEKQGAFLKVNGLTTQDMFAAQEGVDYTPTDYERQGYIESVQAIPAVEPTVGEKIGRAFGRGVATAQQIPRDILESIQLERKYGENESIYAPSTEKDWMDKIADRWAAKGETYLKANKPLITDQDSYLMKITGGAAESLPTSMAMMGAAAIPVVGPAASFGAMGQSTIAQKFKEITAELDKKGIPYDPKEVYQAAVRSGISEGVSETASDVLTLGAGKLFGGAVKAGAKEEVFKSLFGNQLKKAFAPSTLGKTFTASAIGESSSEVANLAYQEAQREQFGLENRFAEQAPIVAGSAALMGGPMTLGSAALAGTTQELEARDIRNILFKGVNDVRKISPEAMLDFATQRAETISKYAPIIEETLGKEAAQNFKENVRKATKDALNPNVEANGALPNNSSIFEKNMVAEVTVPTGKTSDIDVNALSTPSGQPADFNVSDIISKIKEEQTQKQEAAIGQRETIDTTRPMTTPENLQQIQEQEQQDFAAQQEAMQQQQAEVQRQAEIKRVNAEALQVLEDEPKTITLGNETYKVRNKPNKQTGEVDTFVDYAVKTSTGTVKGSKRMSPKEALDFMNGLEQKASTPVETVTPTTPATKTAPKATGPKKVTKVSRPDGTTVTETIPMEVPTTQEPVVAQEPALVVQEEIYPDLGVPLSQIPEDMTIPYNGIGIKQKNGTWKVAEAEMPISEVLKDVDSKLEAIDKVLDCVKGK